MSQARDTVAEKVKQAAAQQGAQQQAEPAPEPEPCDVAVIFALGMEVGGLVDQMTGVVTTHAASLKLQEGAAGGRHVVAVAAGVGREAAAAAARAVRAAHRPKWVLAAGFAGGLETPLKLGDVVMVDAVRNEQGHCLKMDLKVDRQALAGTSHVHVGTLLTVDHVLRDPAEKRRMAAQHQAIAVDMESFAVAEVCQAETVRFLAVRVISDEVDQKLPPEIEHLLQQQRLLGRVGAVAGAVFRRPSSVKDMWKLKEDALVASDRLGRFLVGVIEQLE